MTDAAYKKMNNGAAMSGQRISTHPSYTEYSWDALARPQRPAYQPSRQARPAQQPRQTSARQQPMRTQAQAGAQPRGGTQTRPKVAYNAANPAMNPARGGSYAPQTRRPADRTYGKAPGVSVGRAARPNPGAKTKQQSRTAAKSRTKTVAAKAERLRRKSITAIHTIAAERRYAFPLAVVLIALCFTILVMAIVTTSVQINEITTENSELESRYSEMESQKNELQLRLETRDDLRTVENMAKNELGMVKKDQVERYHLIVHKEDRIEIVEEVEEERTSIFDGIMSFGGSVVERIRGFFGM